MGNKMSNIILIVGPTGVGKTKLSIKIAKQYDAEIINTDKMAMYEETNIGTAKIKPSEMKGIKHHFISSISLNDDYSIYDFQKDGRSILNNLIKEKKNVVIVGGSGLYTKALLYNYKLMQEDKIVDTYDEKSNKELKKFADSLSKNNIHENNRKRLIRFIHSYNNGKLIENTKNKNKPLYNFISIGLQCERNKLYTILNNRVDIMINKGLIKETKRLYKKNYKNLEYIIGYKELCEYLDKKISLEEAIGKIKTNTRHYAKRQYTWFNNQMKDIEWFEINVDNFNKTVKEIQIYLDEKITN